MSNYIGVRCPVCNKKFTEADDIVVCPVCGAPHHRDCYNEVGQCQFAADHLSGREWRDPAGEVPPHEHDDATTHPKTCSRCGAANTSEQIFCQVCGNPLAIQPPPYAPGHSSSAHGAGEYPGGQRWGYPPYQTPVDSISMAYGGLSPDETIDGESVKDIAQYVGSGSAYYLPRFQILAQHARVISINLSALIFGFLYYFYRKMYLLGSILLALYVVSSIPSYLYYWEFQLPELMYTFGLGPVPVVDTMRMEYLQRLYSITYMLNFVIVAIMSFMANRFYFNRVITAVHEIRAKAGEKPDPQQYTQTLTHSGGNSKGAVVAVLATLATAVFIASAVMLNLYARDQQAGNRAANTANQSAVVKLIPEETVNE